MPSSEDSGSRPPNTWTLYEFEDLVTAWELGCTRPPNDSAQTLHDAVFKHFVALRGGSTRRNKAALTSKRSALRFSYLYMRDFDNEQKAKGLPLYFDLDEEKKAEIFQSWKKTNSSLVEINPHIYYGLSRIVSQGEEEPVLQQIRKRQKEVHEKMETRPKRTLNAAKTTSKKKQPVARTTSTQWSSEEMMQLVKAWGIAAQLVCDSDNGEPMSIVHEIFRQFENLQGGNNVRNLSGLATRRRVLKQSYSRISAFDKIQEMNGDRHFTELPLSTRQNVMRSWKNANLVDLSAEMYKELHNVIVLDARAVALEDMRRSKGGAKVSRGRKAGRPSKKQRIVDLVQESKDDDEETGSTFSSHPPSTIDDSEEEKEVIPLMVIQSREEIVPSTTDRPEDKKSSVASEPSVGEIDRVSKAPAPSSETTQDNEAKPVAAAVDEDPFPAVSSSQPHVVQKPLKPKRGINPYANIVPILRSEEIALEKKKKEKLAKKKLKVKADVPSGHLWENAELQLLINAWEKAAILVCNSDPAERLSLNREMYREFVELQGGSSVRNSTALAARRSSLKFSYAHINSFNESQKAKGEPLYHEIPEGTRMTLLRSWKNRNSVDLTKEMFDGLGRILAMDEKLAAVRSLRPHFLPKPKKKIKIPAEPKAGSDQNVSKTAKWTAEETSDLIKACADVMNAPTDKELSQTDRESLIYDAFVARRKNAGDTDTPVRRDLRTMAQQWRYILGSYSYIKACNDSHSEADNPDWFEMSAMQKRAYQQCTNVPLKFVDLDAEMFALVTKTSFVGVPAPPALPSPATTPTEGISLRPRSTRKRTEAFWSSDSESSDTELSSPSKNDSITKDPTFQAGKKGNNWPMEEIWHLIQAWEESVATTKSGKLTSALNVAFANFVKRDGGSYRHRTMNSVRNKMIALKSSFAGISAYIAEQGDSSAWFDMTADERLAELRTWGNKTIMDLNKEMFNALARILHRKTSGAYEGGGVKRKKSPGHSESKKDQETKILSGHKPEKYVAANWDKQELLMLSEACGELLEGRRIRRYMFEEEKDRFFRHYEELGGGNSLAAAMGLARFMLDSYEFIYFYNYKATDTNCLNWFELDPADRDPILRRMSKTYRSLNGLNSVDQEIYEVIDALDAKLRVKLNEKKKKTYRPPNDAGSSRYVDIEVVAERCTFKKRSHSAPKKMVEEEEASSGGEADLSYPESEDEASESESSAPVARPQVPEPEPAPRRRFVRPPSSRKRSREVAVAVEAPSTLAITDIIQNQNRKLEEAVKRFRKDSVDARKEHHNFLLRKIQDSFPADTGNGSFLERVAERQGQALADIFQRLQQQRRAEKAKDEALMHELFGL
ncbi:hypothetical protein P3T76_012308 [Phytophthora citrophthora]|uniref:Uncharacterized protein n=1 Tax=Phytophthora citrophthora TaxID=4793 RepID=A0AAD9G5Q4_9STRA|nr:hypothetical protein P3T76_012308 [Phytophthora citrophthora]